ncbi:hypothetical protein D3C73_1318360 [compost metagenome]
MVTDLLGDIPDRQPCIGQQRFGFVHPQILQILREINACLLLKELRHIALRDIHMVSHSIETEIGLSKMLPDIRNYRIDQLHVSALLPVIGLSAHKQQQISGAAVGFPQILRYTEQMQQLLHLFRILEH